MNAEEDLYVGNDHRTVAATFEIKRKQTKNNKLKQKNEVPANLKAWEPADKDEYAEAHDKNVIYSGCTMIIALRLAGSRYIAKTAKLHCQSWYPTWNITSPESIGIQIQ